MPAAIPAVIAAASAYASGATIFGLSAALSATLIGIGSFALNTLGGMLAPKPKKQEFGDLSTSRTQQVKQPITERRVIYGEVKVSGAITYFGSTQDNKYLHIVLTLATHQCHDMLTTWFNEDPIHADELDSDGNVVSGKYAGKARIKKHLGQAGQIVDPDLLVEFDEITENFVGNEISYIYVRLEKDDELYKSGLPNLQQWVVGALVYDTRTSTTYWSPNSTLCLRDYFTNTRYGLSTPTAKFPTANVTSSSNSCDEIVATKPLVHTVTEVTTNATAAAPVSAPVATLGSAGNISSDTHKYVVTFITDGAESPPSPESNTINVPPQNSQILLSSIPTGGAGTTARVIYRTKQRGNTFFKVATISNNTATTYTDNVADVDLGSGAPPGGSLLNRLTLNGDLLKFQTGDRVELTTTGTLPAGLDLETPYYVIVRQMVGTLIIKLASSYQNAITGTAVDITDVGSGTHTVTKTGEPRYTTNGTLGTASKPADNITDLLSAMAGDVLPVGGKWIIKPAVWVAPTITFDENDMAGALEISPKHTRRERFNAVQGLFVTPANLGEAGDYPLVKDDTYITEDGGEMVIAQLDLPFTSRSQMAQRVARVQLNRHRRQRTVQLTTNLSGMRVQAGDTFQLTLANHRYTEKVFEVGDFNLVPRTDRNGKPVLTCDIVANESDSAIYDFDETTQELVPQPPQSIVRGNPDNVTPPGAPSVAEVKYVTTDGTGVKVQGDVSFTASTDFFVRHYEVEHRLQPDGEWKTNPPTNTTSLTIYDLAPGNYDIRVRARTIFNAASIQIYSTFTIIGLADLPSDVQGFSVISLSDNAELRWEQATDIDVKVSGWVRLRHSADTVDYTWGNARDIVPAIPGVSTGASVPLLDGVYMAKFVDSTGNESEDPAVVQVSNTKIVNMNVVATATEHTAFAGTKTNMVAQDGVLRLDGAGLFDATTGDFDDADGDFDAGAGVGQSTTGTYAFVNGVDCGKVTTAYVTSHILHEVYNASDFFDAREGNFDSAADLFDSADIAGINPVFYLRMTDDDPAGTPTWGDWIPFVAGYFRCRAYQFKTEFTSLDSSYQIDVTELSATVDTPDVIDGGSVTTASGSLDTFNFAASFTVAPKVVATINDAQAGDLLVVPEADVTAGNFKAGVLNSGSYVVRNLTWFARGQ